MGLILSTSQSIIPSAETHGGKGMNLLRLVNLGMNVPPFAIVTTEAYDLRNDASFFNELKQSISSFASQHKTKFFAVRSSASIEDGAKFSLAGQLDSYLYVAADLIVEHVKKVWDSAHSEHLKTYLEQHAIEEDFKVAVVIQIMVDSDVSGVAFGMNPLNGDQSEMIISSTFGQGEGLVSGVCVADNFVVKNQEIKSTLAEKKIGFYQAKEGGLEERTIDLSLQKKPSLSDDHIHQIVSSLKELRANLGSPQDVEFAIVDNEIFILQTRPITTVNEGEYTVWDNSNIVESYPGITTPLTFSFILEMYEFVYKQFVGLLGISDEEIQENHHVFANTLGLVRGRVYYNLLHWYKMLALLPGYSINASFMETMMGVKEKFELPHQKKLSKTKAWWRVIKTGFHIIRKHFGLGKERKRFYIALEKWMGEYENIDFSRKNSEEMVDLYHRFETGLLHEWKAPIINDFFAMIWFGMLKSGCQKYLKSDNPNIHNDLLCGSQDIISTQPVHRCLEISEFILDDPSLKDWITVNTAEKIWEDLSSKEHPQLGTLIHSYLEDFGERCMGELKLETTSYSQDPVLFIRIVKSYVENDITSKNSSTGLDLQLREHAESEVSKSLKGKIIKKWWFNYILKKARELVSNRENLRYERTRGFGMVRLMFSRMGEILSEKGLIDHSKDVFYLEKVELLKAMEGEEFRDVITERKKEFEEYRNQEIPAERFFNYGQDFSDKFIYSQEKIEPIEGDLVGIGCCPGVVEGRARVVMDPTECHSINGDILVTSSTDPGWVTLFPTSSAIIVERGSLLSHSAIVSREMGIPCVVGITGLLRTVKTGDLIRINGSTGIVQIVEEG